MLRDTPYFPAVIAFLSILLSVVHVGCSSRPFVLYEPIAEGWSPEAASSARLFYEALQAMDIDSTVAVYVKHSGKRYLFWSVAFTEMGLVGRLSSFDDVVVIPYDSVDYFMEW